MLFVCKLKLLKAVLLIYMAPTKAGFVIKDLRAYTTNNIQNMLLTDQVY